LKKIKDFKIGEFFVVVMENSKWLNPEYKVFEINDLKEEKQEEIKEFIRSCKS